MRLFLYLALQVLDWREKLLDDLSELRDAHAQASESELDEPGDELDGSIRASIGSPELSALTESLLGPTGALCMHS